MDVLPGQLTADLIAQMEQCVKAFCMDEAVYYEGKTTFIHQQETYDNVRSHDIDIYYNSYIVRFSYYPHVPLTMAHSVLTCYISLDKAEEKRLFYPLSQLYGYCNLSPENALTIPMITTADSMKACFDCLTAALRTISSQTRDLAYTEDRKTALFNSETEAAVALFKREYPADEDLRKFLDNAQKEWYPAWKAGQEREHTTVTEAEMQADFELAVSRLMSDVHALLEADIRSLLSIYFQHLMMRSLSAGNEAYMAGDYAVAIKKLRKQKYRTPYENGLVAYMEGAKALRPHVPEDVFQNITELYKGGIPKNSFKEALAVAAAMLLFGLIWLPLFLAVYFLFYFIESRDAVYLLGSLSNAPSAVLPAMLMGIPMIYFNSKRFYKLFFKKNYQKLMELENVTRTRGAHRFMKWLISVLLAGSVIFLFLTVHQNIKLTSNGFYDNTDFWRIQGRYYQYEEVEGLYYRAQTPGEYGDMLLYPSYIVRLKSGEEIDLSLFDSCEEKFLDAFRNKGVWVEEPYLVSYLRPEQRTAVP